MTEPLDLGEGDFYEGAPSDPVEHCMTRDYPHDHALCRCANPRCVRARDHVGHCRDLEGRQDPLMPEPKKPLDVDTWRRNRGTYVGGSDVAAIMGLSPYRNIGDVWIEKVRAQEKLELGDETMDPEVSNRFTEWGRELEDVILRRYARDTGYQVNRPGLQLFRHPELPFIGGTLDGEAETPFGDRYVVEGKCTDAFYQARARIWGEQGTDQVPEWFVPQGMQYLIVRGLKTRCDFAVLIGGNDFRLYHVAYDAELAEQMIELQVWFWGLVTRREAPPMDFAAANATKLQRRIHDKIAGGTKVITDPAEQLRVLKLIQERDYAHEQAKYWGGENGQGGLKGKATAELLSIAGDFGRVEIPVEVGGKRSVVAINRKPKAGYEVAAYTVEPSITLSFDPHQLKKRDDLFTAMAEEQQRLERAVNGAPFQIPEGGGETFTVDPEDSPLMAALRKSMANGKAE